MATAAAATAVPESKICMYERFGIWSKCTRDTRERHAECTRTSYMCLDMCEIFVEYCEILMVGRACVQIPKPVLLNELSFKIWWLQKKNEKKPIHFQRLFRVCVCACVRHIYTFTLTIKSLCGCGGTNQLECESKIRFEWDCKWWRQWWHTINDV